MVRSHPTSFQRIGLVLALAYALTLQGLLGAIAAGQQAREAQLAAQLGVICTIHGIVDPATGRSGSEDPTPGKLACVEHCVTQLAQPLAALPDGQHVAPAHSKLVVVHATAFASGAPAYPSAAPPPPRGPPAT